SVFFFQAEDGIRDDLVTGVQTCALPILRVEEMLRQVRRVLGTANLALSVMTQNFAFTRGYFGDATQVHLPDIFPPFLYREVRKRSEERRVGKEGRYRWSP